MAGKFEIKKAAAENSDSIWKRETGVKFCRANRTRQKRARKKGVESARKNAPDDNRCERKTAKNDEAYFVLKARNGEPPGRSETYSSSPAMENGIELVKKNAPDAEIAYVSDK